MGGDSSKQRCVPLSIRLTWDTKQTSGAGHQTEALLNLSCRGRTLRSRRNTLIATKNGTPPSFQDHGKIAAIEVLASKDASEVASTKRTSKKAEATAHAINNERKFPAKASLQMLLHSVCH